MRYLPVIIACLVSTAAWAARPLFQAELDITNAVEVTAGVAYQISGRVTDRSVMGYDGLSVAAGDLVFSETITGDVDAWAVTNVVASNAVHVTLDVVYQPAGGTNLTLEFPAGPSALCTVSTTATTGYPQPPSETGAALSAHLLNEIRSYSFRLVPSVGADTGATGIVAGATDSYDETTRTLTWNTNAAGGGGSGDASLWYEYPALTQVEFRARSADLTTTGAPWTVGPYLLHSNAFEIAHEGTAFVQVDTNGQLIVSGDIYGNGVSLADTLARATAGSNLAASVRADFDPASNRLDVLQGQFVASSSTWVKANGTVPITGSITSSFPMAGRQPGWQMRVGSNRLLTNSATTTLGFDTIVSSNQVTFSTTAFTATPLVPGVYIVTANAWVYGISGAAGSEGRIQIRKAGTVIGCGSFLSAKTATDSYFPTAVAIEYFNGSEACDVNILHAWGNGLTNGADARMKFSGTLIGTGW